MKSLHQLYILVLGFCLLASCSAEQEPIGYGTDNCQHCKMTISDNRYGSEIVTRKGKVYKFDSIECMAAYLNQESNVDTQLLLVTDFTQPGTFTQINKASFLQSEQMPSPMGMNLTAFADSKTAGQFAQEKNGKLVSWKEILKMNMGHGNH